MLKKKYTIYANCQGQALARVLNSSQAFREKYQYFQIKPVQEINLDYLNNFINSVIPQIDLFIFQPVSEKYKNYFRYSSKYITSHLKKDCRQLSFPSCYFQGYHPELRPLKDKNGTNISVPIYWNKKILHSTLVHDGNIIAGFCNRKSIIDIKNQFLEIEDVIKQYFEFYKTIPMEILRNNIRDWNL